MRQTLYYIGKRPSKVSQKDLCTRGASGWSYLRNLQIPNT